MAGKKNTKAAPKTTPIKEKMTKSQMIAEIADRIEISKKQVSGVFDELSNLIGRHIRKGGAGEFTIPGLLKIKTRIRPARKAQKNVPSPFTGELRDVPARPATRVVKALPLKALKEVAKD